MKATVSRRTIIKENYQPLYRSQPLISFEEHYGKDYLLGAYHIGYGKLSIKRMLIGIQTYINGLMNVRYI